MFHLSDASKSSGDILNTTNIFDFLGTNYVQLPLTFGIQAICRSMEILVLVENHVRAQSIVATIWLVKILVPCQITIGYNISLFSFTSSCLGYNNSLFFKGLVVIFFPLDSESWLWNNVSRKSNWIRWTLIKQVRKLQLVSYFQIVLYPQCYR